MPYNNEDEIDKYEDWQEELEPEWREDKDHYHTKDEGGNY